MADTDSRVITNTILQLWALLFLLVGTVGGLILGWQVGAASDGRVSDLTRVTEVKGMEMAFNWLLFEIGVGAGLVSCAVLLAASFTVVPGNRG